MTRSELGPIVEEAVRNYGGKATIVEVAKYIWDNYEDELRKSGSLFFTWQYDMRWEAQKLRDVGRFKSADNSTDGVWELA
jgi:hypothetical protein